MKFARYWAKERAEATDGKQRISALSRGWSNDSLDAAVRAAKNNADRLARLLLSGSAKDKRYFYGERPLPEPILEEFKSAGGEVTAAVTRNRYGALVLNSTKIMFIDVDRKHRVVGGGGLGGLVKSLFGGAPPAEQKDQFAAEIEDAVAQEPTLGIRLYRTNAGYRLLITGHEIAPDSSESERLLEKFGSDALYRKLCKFQQSFRARLTPKPWRCGVANPPVSFPYRDDAERAKFESWLGTYEKAIGDFATCEFLGHFGNQRVTREAEIIGALHDRICNINSGRPLA